MNLKNCWLLSFVAGFMLVCCGASVNATNISVDQGNAELERLAISQFAAFGKAMGVPSEELQNPKVVNYGTFVTASNNKWSYRAAFGANQTFKPTTTLPYLKPCFETRGQQLQIDGQRDRLLQDCWNLARSLECDRNTKYTKDSVRIETLLDAKCSEPVSSHSGRFLCRLSDDDIFGFFQVIFDRAGHPIRVDTNAYTPGIQRIMPLLSQSLKRRDNYVALDGDTEFKAGTFYSGGEDCFEKNAFSFEGRSFAVSLYADNPYRKDTQEYEWWCREWWNRCGGVNSVRGNWDEQQQTWQRPKVQMAHYLLGQYALSGDVPGDSYRIEPKFYKDLESCTVAAFFTHGGSVKGDFQLDSGTQRWFIPGSLESPYGSGDLRYLFVFGCGAMGDQLEVHTEDQRTLAHEWMRGKNIAGLRATFGFDGSVGTADRDGWLLFRGYNMGDSLSDAFLNGGFFQGNPAAVFYGDSAEQALAGLADGRIEKERVQPTYAVASTWQELETLPTSPPKNALWLDTLDVSKMRQDWGEPHARTSVDGNALHLGGKKYTQGIGTHADSEFAIDLKGAVTRFTATEEWMMKAIHRKVQWCLKCGWIINSSLKAR